MSVTEPRATRKDWSAILARVERSHPLTRAPQWERLLDNTDVMAAIVRDLIVIDRQPPRRGARPLPSYDEGRQRIQALFGEDFSTAPFREAFAALTRGQSRTQIARTTGLARTRVHRLLTGGRIDRAPSVEPTAAEMETIAAAYGRRPEYFHEYRTGLILALAAEELDRNRERAIVVVRQLAAQSRQA